MKSEQCSSNHCAVIVFVNVLCAMLVTCQSAGSMTEISTSSLVDCAVTCYVNATKGCKNILYGEPTLPNSGNNCGMDYIWINADKLATVSSGPDSLVAYNMENSTSDKNAPECQTFIYLNDSQPRTIVTPSNVTSGQCRLLVGAPHKHQIMIEAKVICNNVCYLDDSLIVNNVLLSLNQSDVGSACQHPNSQSPLILQSGDGGYVDIQFRRRLYSEASYEITLSDMDSVSSNLSSPTTSHSNVTSTLYSVPPCDINTSTSTISSTSVIITSDVSTRPSNLTTSVGGASAQSTPTTSDVSTRTSVLITLVGGVNTKSTSTTDGEGITADTFTNSKHVTPSVGGVSITTTLQRGGASITNDSKYPVTVDSGLTNHSTAGNDSTVNKKKLKETDETDPDDSNKEIIIGATVGSVFALMTVVAGLLYRRFKRSIAIEPRPTTQSSSIAMSESPTPENPKVKRVRVSSPPHTQIEDI